VIIEVAYSQKRKRLSRLAEDYLLDSDATVQVVAGLDIEYGKEGSRKATLSVWRAQIAHTTNGDELRAFREIADEVCLITVSFRFWSLTFLHSRSGMIKDMLLIIQVYDFNYPTLLAKTLHKM
jgi:hypothetical protein